MEFSDYIGTFGALIFVLMLIWGLSVAARRFGLVPGARIPGKTNNGKRLRVLDVLALDTKRRLLLVAKDDDEHLILLGPTSELIVDKSPATSKPDNIPNVTDEDDNIT